MWLIDSAIAYLIFRSLQLSLALRRERGGKRREEERREGWDETREERREKGKEEIWVTRIDEFEKFFFFIYFSI